MSTNKAPETPATRDTPTTTPRSATAGPKSKMIFTVFPRGATPKQIADALNEIRRQHSTKR